MIGSSEEQLMMTHKAISYRFVMGYCWKAFGKDSFWIPTKEDMI